MSGVGVSGAQGIACDGLGDLLHSVRAISATSRARQAGLVRGTSGNRCAARSRRSAAGASWPGLVSSMPGHHVMVST
ncbi:MAG TPA: hypothetical protein VMV07_00305, partial [Streptosporangiaceae bacterium]|nr:hypothetical protein [Streptosporangiaceae bacterium]